MKKEGGDHLVSLLERLVLPAGMLCATFGSLVPNRLVNDVPYRAINSRTHAACLLPCFTIPAAIGLRQPGPQGSFGHEITEILIQFHIGRIL